MSIDKFVYDENGEAVGFYGHSEFDEDSPQDVADLWEELMGDIWDDGFSLSKFQRAAKLAFHVLQPYLNRDLNTKVSLPTEYVRLLLWIDRFAQHPVDAGKELAAARLVSEGFIDQVLYGVFDQLPEEQAQTIFHFECDETEKTYDIQAETFDLTALIQDLQKDEEFEFEEFEFLDDPRGE